MAINQLIAQGDQTRGFDVQNALGGIEKLKNMQSRNKLMDLAVQQQPEQMRRNDEEYAQGQAEQEFKMMQRAAQEYVGLYEAGGIDAADRVIANLPNTGKFIQMKQDYAAARQTATPDDDEQFYKNAIAVAQMGQQEGAENQPADVRSFEYFRNLPQEAQQQMMQFKRAGKIVKIAGVDHIIDSAGNGTPINTPEGAATLEAELSSANQLAGATESGKQDAAIDAIPKRGEAERGVELANTQVDNETTFAIYETAMGNLMDSLGNTDTGPFVGRLPALSANQQISDSMIAAIAPVLKQLFRSAGEGIFTDKDQELLLDMVPSRKLHPEARAAAFRNIDAIIRAKLKIGPPATGIAAQPKVMRFDAQGNEIVN